MAGHWNYRPGLPIQVCSIDTLTSREIAPEADLIIVDECHMARSRTYRELLEKYPDAYIVAVTATPYGEESYAHLADEIVWPITMEEMIKLGFLVPFEYYAPDLPSMKKVRKTKKDFNSDDTAEIMSDKKIVGSIIEHYKKIANNKATICFAANVKHSKYLCEEFLRAGIKAEHVDAHTPEADRIKIIKRVESGATEIVCNVGILTTGVDIPCVEVIIDAAPTKSLILHVQKLGRGSRTFPGKTKCKVLDHTGNLMRNGFPTDEPEVSLFGFDEKSHKENSVVSTKICKICFGAFRGPICPVCGEQDPTTEIIKEVDGELKKVSETDFLVQKYLKELTREQKKTGKSKTWIYHQLFDRFGIEPIKDYVSEYFYISKKVGFTKVKTLPDYFSNSRFKSGSGRRT